MPYVIKTNPMKYVDEKGNLVNVGALVGVPLPKPGEDYFTEEDKKEIIDSVLDKIPNGNEVEY